MPGRVEEHPERRARLVLVLAGADGQHLGLREVEVQDVEIEVELLRCAVGPLRGYVVRRQLEGEPPPSASWNQSSSARSTAAPVIAE